MATTIFNPSYKKRLAYHATLLGGVGLLASAALVLGNVSTNDTIQLRIKEDMQASLTQVVPPSKFDNDIFEDTLVVQDTNKDATLKDVKVYRARMKGKIVAVAYEAIALGYSGPIVIIMGVDSNGGILGVRILSHAETPGLGDKIEADKSDWIKRFTGHSLSNTSANEWKVKKDGGEFDQFSGATITPRAVVKAIHNGLVFFAENKETLFLENKDEPAAKKKAEQAKLINKYMKMSSVDIMNIINKI